MRNYNSHNQDEKGIPANVPMRHYDPEDRIALVNYIGPRPPVSTRAAIKGINVPDDEEDFQTLNLWRARYNLPPVVGE